MEDYGQPCKIYQNPWYSKASDAPERPREYAGLVYHLKGGTGLGIVEDWKEDVDDASCDRDQTNHSTTRELHPRFIDGWEYTGLPPGHRETRKWAKVHPNESSDEKHRPSPRSQVRVPLIP